MDSVNNQRQPERQLQQPLLDVIHYDDGNNIVDLPSVSVLYILPIFVTNHKGLLHKQGIRIVTR